MSGDAVAARIRDLRQVAGLLAWAQEQYHQELTAWLAGDRTGPPPAVPDGYRQAVARLQVALGHLDLAVEQRATAAPPGGAHDGG